MMKSIFKEGDMVLVSDSITAEVIGEKQTVSLPAGSKGAVVLVYENGEAYEIEFYISKSKEYALSTVSSEKVLEARK